MDERSQDLRLIEALLFASAEPLAESEIAARLGPEADIPGLVEELETHYRGRGVNLARVAGKLALRTAPDLAPRLQLERVVTRKMSRAAIETLAIIAYHQPVTRGEIEEIRGVALSKGVLDTLIEAGWIRPKGHKETPGRPATWVTTEEFLLHFGLEALSDLPGVDELRAAGLLDARPTTSIGESAEPPPSEGEGEAESEPAEEPAPVEEAPERQARS
jgi:segregation and condensation protein B